MEGRERAKYSFMSSTPGRWENYFQHCTIRLLHIVKDRDRARRRGPHHVRIDCRHPPHYITFFFVPTSTNHQLHEIALHFLTR